ncbi:MAG TPA: DinB family protein [Puia sp.]|jgi:hypothetical protein|nr:DinB family protein [Puia sp.]
MFVLIYSISEIKSKIQTMVQDNLGWNKDIDKVTEKFSDSFGSLTGSQLNHKPNPNVWSIAQNIYHIILLNNSYFECFDEIKRGNHLLPQVDAMEQFAIDSLETIRPYASTARPKKANTWDKWQPSITNIDFKILKIFRDHQSVFKIHIKELQEFNLNQTFVKYPGDTNLIFSLDECINFLIEHENRHWIQANEVKHVLIPSEDG